MREEKMKYERLSKRALGCMYVSTVILSVILLAAIIYLRKCILAQSKRYPDWRDNILGARCSDHSELCNQPVFPVPEIWLSHR